MPVSRNRKNHKKKVMHRNKTMQHQMRSFQKLYNEKVVEQLKQLHEEYLKNSGETTDRPILPADNTQL